VKPKPQRHICEELFAEIENIFMTVAKLSAALSAVDWNNNVQEFLTDAKSAEIIADVSMKLAVWARQLETVDHENPAISFIREMQVSSQQVAALTALALYKTAAGSMRAMFENALYYTYFRTHLSELETLVREPTFFVDKRQLIEYHKTHTIRFTELQNKLGLVSRLNAWYSKVSAVVHGQIPGKWTEHKALSDVKHIKATRSLVVEAFWEGGDLVHCLFLCTVGQTFWDSFSTPSKKMLLAALSGDLKKALMLDIA
jgi:hypothetical protein